METLFVVKEEEIKKWIKEAISECLGKVSLAGEGVSPEEPLISRREAAKRFNISTNTLTNWVADGLPHYKKKRRIMFLDSEIREHMKKSHKLKPNF